MLNVGCKIFLLLALLVLWHRNLSGVICCLQDQKQTTSSPQSTAEALQGWADAAYSSPHERAKDPAEPQLWASSCRTFLWSCGPVSKNDLNISLRGNNESDWTSSSWCQPEDTISGVKSGSEAYSAAIFDFLVNMTLPCSRTWIQQSNTGSGPSILMFFCYAFSGWIQWLYSCIFKNVNWLKMFTFT